MDTARNSPQSDLHAHQLERALRTLSAGNRSLLRADDEKTLLWEMCRVIVEEGGYRMAWVGYVEHDERRTLRPMAHAGMEEGILDDFLSWDESPETSTASARAICTGKPCVARSLSSAPEIAPARRAEARKRGYETVSAFPLLIGGEAIGNLTIFSTDPDAFSDVEVNVLAELSEDLAFGINSLRVRSAKERAEARRARKDRALRTLSAGNRTLLRSADTQREQQLLEDMCRCAVELGGYTYAWVGYAMHDPAKTIRPMAAVGVELEHFVQLGLSWGEAGNGSPSEVAIRTGKPSARRDFRNDADLAQWREDSVRLGFSAASAYPLWVDGEVIGAFGVGAAEMDAFDDEELAILAEMVDDLAFGISTLRLHAKQAEAERTIRRLAYEDSLTGLPNRARLREVLGETIAEARRSHHSFALLMVNVDRFREINEVIGYCQGDLLLQGLAARLRSLCGNGSTLARVGGDEFAVVLPGADAGQAGMFARKLLKGLDEPFEFSGIRVDVRASIGIALFPGHGAEPDILALRADTAMAQAKRSHSGFAMAHSGADKAALRRMTLIGDLRRGIEDNQLRLYCQPKADLKSGAICGAEALVRWQHPQQGLLAPDVFIPLAERTGLITPLTYWVLNAALGQCYDWRETGLAVPLAVNLSTHDLQAPDFLDHVSGLVTTWGAEPDWVQFELTESALMDDPARALSVLRELQAMGFRLFVDDFGTGYSSLGYLQKLPLYAMKIDKSFVLNMAQDPDSQTIVHSTIQLGHNIGLQVVAEGTENLDIWNQLGVLGSDVAQGSYISEPMPAEQFRAWHAGSSWH